MTVSTADLGRTVTWTEHDHQRTGILHRLPSPGTPDWWRTNGKAVVAITHDDTIHHIQIHPNDLTPDDAHTPADLDDPESPF